MTPGEFNRQWNERYPECLPIAHQLKFVYRDRWFRVHTLPESKRYAETEDEYQEILSRHNTILTDLLRDEGHFVLLTSGYSHKPAPVRPEHELEQLICGNYYLRSVAMHQLEGDDEPRYAHFYMNERTWKAHSLDDLLRMVADDVIANVLFVGVQQECIYHPYDGGGDVLLQSEDSRDLMKGNYTSWLSKHSEGL